MKKQSLKIIRDIHIHKTVGPRLGVAACDILSWPIPQDFP